MAMASKALFVLALLLASAVLLATAAEQTHDKEEKVSAGLQDWHGDGGYPGHGGGGGGYPGHGGGGGGYPSRCRWGCCRRGYHGGCDRCCGTADEVPEPMDRPEVHN